MFSCYRAARLIADRLERPLSRRERVSLWVHFWICRHCCMHDRQIRGLARLLEMKRAAGDEQGLSADARARIGAALSERFPTP